MNVSSNSRDSPEQYRQIEWKVVKKTGGDIYGKKRRIGSFVQTYRRVP